MSQEKLQPGHTRLTPAERSARAKLAASVRWAKTTDRTAATEPMRRAHLAKFEKEVDPDGSMLPEQRAKLAESARQAHLARMRFLALKAKHAANVAEAAGAE